MESSNENPEVSQTSSISSIQ